MSRLNTNIGKRILTFRHSDSPLTSKRVRIILSNSEDSKKLSKAVRSLRHKDTASFEVSEDTVKKLKDLQQAL